MAEGTRCVREITVFSSNQRSRLVEYNVGAQPSTKIRDDETFKFHVGGGYGYVPSSQSSSISGNRFIYWRISENILELIEESLDVNLSGNCLKIRFLDSTLVPGLSVFETPTSICILVATTNSVHRIVFTHPNKLHGHMFGLSYDQTAPSIFSTISMSDLREPWNFATFSQCCVTSSAWLCQDGHSLFALATEMGSILLVKLPPNGIHGEPEIFELQQSSMMQRLWSGLVPSSLRGDASLPDGIIDLQIHSLGQQMCIFTLCRDHKIRIWSCQKQECISVKDVLEDVPDDVDSSAVNAQNHKMRICFDYKTERLHVGIFLALQYQNQFCVYEALVDGKDVYLSSVSNLYAATGSLVDFSLTSSEIWAQWNTNDGESMTSFTTFENSESDSGWSKVLCSSDTGSLAIVVPSHQEPKEVYLAELFYPGRFDDQAIVKSLQIYQHGVQPGFSPDDRTELRQQVINLIDTEIQLSASNCELNYSEYYELQLSCWEKFFSCVVQYQQAASQAIGLFVDKTTNLVVAIKKDMLSVLKDCEGAEKLYLLPVIEDVNTFGQELLLNKSLKKGLLSVYNSIRHISHQLSNANKVDIENDLKYGCNPTQLACQIADSLVSNESDYDQQPTDSRSEWILELETSLQGVSNLLECFEMVIRLLDLSGIQVEENSSGSVLLGSHPKFGSHFMHNILSLSYMQTMETYMLMCRDFLVFLAVVDRLGSRAGVNPNFSQDISSVYIPKVVLLLRVYHCLHWISKLDVTQAPSNAIESNLKQLAALEISDGNQVKLSEDYPKTTVLKLFLRKVGGSQLQLLMSKIQKTNQQFDSIPISVLINQAVLCLAGSIWPTNPSVVLPEFLLTNYQYLHLQDYCHLIESWCDVSQTYRQFLSGQSYLILGENLKALDCFLHAAQGIDVDDCLMQNFLQADTTNKESLAVLFYVKVMRLFEQFDVPDMVIAVANTAISTASPDDPNIPNLWSNIFKHHLQLGHNDDAYAALTSNPDISRKRDCLHRFMVVLCERGQLQELCEYPYVNLHDEFVDIMESHARTIDITTHQYYDLLYAFHVFRGNYRKAGSVMYEYGGRLGRELAGKNGLQKQAKCYLAAINALQLVDPKNAWIVTPWDREQKKKTEEPPNTSPKRKHGDEEAWYGVDRRKRTKRKLTIVELKDLEKEYMLVLARLQLLRLDADPSQGTGPPLTADETMTLLIQAGLYDTAFTLASSFNLPREAIFEGITARCVRHSFNIGLTSRSGGIDNKEAWEWLLENDTGKTQPSHDKRIADQAWQLLQSYLEKLKDTVNSPVYYRCVVTKLLTMGAPLPTWLTNHYKRLNPSELLYVLVTYDMLQEAADLAIEYINAVLGEGKEYFGLKTGLHATMPSVWLPYTTLDHLLIALEEASPNSNLAKMYDKLVDKLEQYHEQVTRVSEDMITTAWKRAHRRHMSESLPWQ